MRTSRLTFCLSLLALSAGAATFPTEWTPVSINSSDGGVVNLGDPTTDGANNGRNIVGDNARPAFFVASDATHFFFRIRLDSDPSGPGGLASFGWGILIDSDGLASDYDYSLMINGTNELLEYAQKTTKTLAGDPTELANRLIDAVPTVYSGAAQNVRLAALGAGTTGFSGNEDYFLDVAIPLSTFYGSNPDGGAYLNFTPTTPLRFWVGVSNSSRNIQVDLGGTINSPGPGTLPGTVSTPTVLCNSDAVCGGATSGQICNAGACLSGCRGTDGNGCAGGLTCTSTTSAAGTCVDSNAPIVVTPAQGAVLGNSTVLISGTSPDGASVQVFVDGAAVGTTTAGGTGGWSLSVALADGSHTVYAIATVAAIVSPASNTNTFTVDTAPPPSPVISTPLDGSLTSSNTPAISGTAQGTATITVFIDGLAAGTTTADASGNWSFTPPLTLADGPHSVQVTATDAAGNTSPASSSNGFTVDTAAPSAPAVATPADASVTGDNTPTLTGTAEANSTIFVFIDGAVVGTTTADSSGSWSFTPAELADGSHTVEATATDAAGNLSTSSGSSAFTVDTASPSAPVVIAPAHDGTSATTTPTVRGTAEAGSTVTVTIDGVIVGSTTADGDGAWSLTSTALTPGTHGVSAIARDGAGNTSIASATNVFTVLPAPPASPVLTAPAGQSLTTDSTPLFTGTAEAGSTVTVRVDGELVCTAQASADGTFSCAPMQPLSEGPHLVTISATNAGGSSTESPATTFTLDTTAPLTPAVVGPADGSRLTDSTPTVVGTGEPGSLIEVTIDGQAAGATTVEPDGTWRFTPATPLTVGAHAVSASATDQGGNASLPSNTNQFVLVTATAQTPSLSSPEDNAAVGSAQPAFTGTAAPGQLVTVRVDGEPACTATADVNGAWTCSPSQPLAEGTHQVVAEVVDALGEAIVSNTHTLIIDTLAPAAPVVTAPPDASSSDDTTPLLAGTGEPLSTVAVFVDGLQVGTAAVDIAGNWSLAVSSELTLGGHTVSARAADRAGNQSAFSNLSNFTITAPSPAPVVLSPMGGASTVDSTPLIAGTSTPNAVVEVRIDGLVVCTATATPSGAWSCAPTAPLIDGGHLVTAQVQGEAETSSPVPFVVDTLAPSAPVVTSPAPNAFTSQQPELAGTAEPGARVEVRVDGAAVCITLADAQGRWRCTPPTLLAMGAHSVLAIATDPAGNRSLPSAAVPFTVDTQAPAAPVLSTPAEGSTSTDPTPLFAGTAEPGSSVTVRVDGVVACTALADAITGAFACEAASALDRGAHQATATATDPANNASLASAPIDFSVVAVTPPAPVITAPAAGQALATGTPTIQGTATPGSTVTVREGTRVVCIATADAMGAWSCTADPLDEGGHRLTATASLDEAESLPSGARDFVVDTTPPVIVVTGAPAEPTTRPTALLSWALEANTTYACSIDGGAFVACTSPLGLSGLQPGPHSLTVRATDAAGNTTEVTSVWSVEAPVEPALPALGLRGGGLSCAAVPGGAGWLALLLLALGRRRPRST